MANPTIVTILLAAVLTLSTSAIAQEKAAPGSHEHHDHSDPAMDHSDHGMDHSGHDMDHSGHDMSHAHPMDHSDHTARSGDTEHGDMHHHHHHDDDHIMDHEGTMIMGQNLDKLPSSCQSISEEVEITVRAGRKYAEKFPGTAFAFDKQQWNVKPCAKVTWHFINEDHVRHQFMMHGLPRYLYKYGMFHLEVTGPKTVTGTIIVPGADETYLVHCDISQHMEKGMKAQLVVGNGGEDIPSIPGLTPYVLNDIYEAEDLPVVAVKKDKDKKSITNQLSKFVTTSIQDYGMVMIGLLIGLLSMPLYTKIRLSIRKKASSES